MKVGKKRKEKTARRLVETTEEEYGATSAATRLRNAATAENRLCGLAPDGGLRPTVGVPQRLVVGFGAWCAGFQALFERFHEVDDGCLAWLGDCGDLLAFLFFRDKALDVFAIRVVEFLGLERGV